jgi:uncharacterized protein
MALSLMRRRSGSVLACLLSHAIAGVVLVSCADSNADVVQGASVMAFDTTSVRLTSDRDTVIILAELARSSAQRTMGLMERPSLPENAGMLFIYEEDQPAEAGFWMYRTRIPLDIAYADSTGRIVAVKRMEPCKANLSAGCPSYPPGQAYRYALEVNAGFFARHGIQVGSRLWSPAMPKSVPRAASRVPRFPPGSPIEKLASQFRAARPPKPADLIGTWRGTQQIITEPFMRGRFGPDRVHPDSSHLSFRRGAGNRIEAWYSWVGRWTAASFDANGEVVFSSDDTADVALLYSCRMTSAERLVCFDLDHMSDISGHAHEFTKISASPSTGARQDS